MNDRKLVRIQEKGQVTIPTEIRKKLGLKQGTSPKIPLSATALMYVAALNNEFWDGFKGIWLR
jgi:hypothetical protein